MENCITINGVIYDLNYEPVFTCKYCDLTEECNKHEDCLVKWFKDNHLDYNFKKRITK